MVSLNTFTGEYAYSLDAKGRVNVPARFRTSLSGDNEGTFVLTKGMDTCIIAYPLTEWQKVETGLRQLSSASKIYRSFIRSTVRYATPVTMDKQGRIQVSPVLREFAGIEKDVMIIGVVNKIEIWNPEKLNEIEDETLTISSDELEDLRDKIVL
ncbi:MAG: division/cell wall cluster transcriptional repressor MraZ [Candidatus Marinimicrobia bacterium]|jgi:MraZ protein|nr:division/cell wall cluster transcriptional repressor MraZ [Candidatus Neomarinimicrobiota bacterium]MDP6593938.1 division/cell wall cluster transcriptional repressor MraZ [Candidatus Neomarinimicrobiota bacterium]MDP6836652.1 division/cell wall cluster transcriptional repressor MraZ [Candidatus Neomarinimicrobiota bacterium]MDP6966551.1 division/cell wall cluster transcriptional repressor MraZ [Candidatus Neomarinimicrobiota bacterium]|tara:strand:- start:357 stop:818 length:462 start_codon:yes stop_codon:yes gene_type:complete